MFEPMRERSLLQSPADAQRRRRDDERIGDARHPGQRLHRDEEMQHHRRKQQILHERMAPHLGPGAGVETPYALEVEVRHGFAATAGWVEPGA